MKKNPKRLLALAGVFLLGGLYLATFLFALIDSAWAYDMFKLCLGFTIVLPVLLYIYLLIWNKGRDSTQPRPDDEPARPGPDEPAQPRPNKPAQPEPDEPARPQDGRVATLSEKETGSHD